MRRNAFYRRVVGGSVIAALAFAGLSAVAARADASTTLTPAHATAAWSHGPITATTDSVTISVDVPADYWTTNPGGVTVRIDTGNSDVELDLAVTNAQGVDLAVSRYGAQPFQQVYLPAPPNGEYVVNVQGAKGAPGPAYTGTAAIVAWSTPQAPTTTSPTMSFVRSIVDPQILANEPGIAIDSRGPIYVDAPNGFNNAASVIWRSDDGAQTFHQVGVSALAGVQDPRRRPCSASGGGGDIDVATDRTGRVYFADLEDFAISAGYSTDRGNTWHCDAFAGLPLGDERPWVSAAPTADGAGPGIDAYITYDDLASGQLPGSAQLSPQVVHVLSTSDGGKTWTTRGSFGAGLLPLPGPLSVGRDGTLYDVFSGSDAVWLARSTDNGKSFTTSEVSQRLSDPRGNGSGWPIGAVDSAGNLYATWVDGGTGDVLYTRSADRGASWTTPIRVNPPGQIAIRAWITAGAANDVALGWYGAEGNFLPGAGAPSGTRWYAYAARNTNASDPTSPFTVAMLSPVPALVGFGDNVDAGSVAADFFKLVIGSDGRLYAAFCDAGRAAAASTYEVAGTVYAAALNAPPQPQPYVVVARQVAGAGLSSTATAASSPAAYDGPQALEFLSGPTLTRVGQTVTATFQLANPDLADALSVPGLAATDAYWVVLMRTRTRQEYVVMHENGQSGTSFLAADQPTGGIYPTTDECCATYPGRAAITGQIDSKTGVVTITAPLNTVHFHAGQRVFDVQAFSLVGRPGSITRFNLLDEGDATPGSTQLLS